MQGWNLNQKIDHTLGAIEQFYNHYNGQVYIAFSGGKDSTVLLHLARTHFPEMLGVFVDTGLEYPEIRDFVKTVDNVEWIRPKYTFKWVIENRGYPIISKKISMGVNRYRTTPFEEQKKLRLYGGTNPTSGRKQHPTISKKWHYLVDAPFKVSEKCCYFLKHEPFTAYHNRTGQHPILGMVADESAFRVQEFLKWGCNAFDKKEPQSTPMMFWTLEDVAEYLQKFRVPYSKIYDMGYTRTGCMFCMFGIAQDSEPNRFQRMKLTHPKQYNYCMNKLGLIKVLDFIGIKYE